MRHDPAECAICDNIKSFPDLPNTQIATLSGVNEATVRRHKRPLDSAAQLQDVDPFFDEVPKAIITSRGRSIRLADGSWEKITYKPQELAFYEALKYDDVEKAIANFSAQPQTPVGYPQMFAANATAVLCLSDWQIGKTGGEGGTNGTIFRILRATDAFCESIKEVVPAEILLYDLGDILENFDNVGSQRATNDLDLTAQVRTARRVLIEVLLRVSAAAPGVPITVISVPSNHCQVRLPGGKDLASTPNNDWGIELSYQLEEILAGRDAWEHVKFLRTSDYAEALTYTTVSGIIIGAVHGHQAQGIEKLGNWWMGQSHGRRNNLHNADILLHGHFHTTRVTQSGDKRWLFGTPSVDPGSDWFTNKTGESATAGMMTFRVNENGWSEFRIL